MKKEGIYAPAIQQTKISVKIVVSEKTTRETSEKTVGKTSKGRTRSEPFL
jgi:hypothetical protein